MEYDYNKQIAECTTQTQKLSENVQNLEESVHLVKVRDLIIKLI